MANQHESIRAAITAYMDRIEGDAFNASFTEGVNKLETVRAAIRACDPELFNWTNPYHSVRNMPNRTEDAIIEQIMERAGCSEDEADQMRAWVWNRVFA